MALVGYSCGHGRGRLFEQHVSPDAGTATDSGIPTAIATGTSTGTSPAPDASIPLPAPATIDLTTDTCTEAVPCGGALEGTWDYSAGCVSDGALSNLEKRVRPPARRRPSVASPERFRVD